MNDVHTIGFARRFLDYRFGAASIDLGSLRPADAIGFMERVLTSARRDKIGLLPVWWTPR